ncbi:MAG TPA: AAA family ATPase, partial [Planctomycetia bacterium]|nr:AAA family ATPase [Planctomycetia bacterium]
LVEMDGFETNAGVIILAATNRPDVLDRALLRPGRFDRQIVVDAPDRNGRIAILKVHARDKKLAPGVDLERVAATTPGFAGADLANAMNEAALMAVRRGHTAISQRDLEDAVEKVVAGPERKSRRLSETEKRRVAYHEAGHALVAFFCEFGDKVEKISIVPRGRMGGYTLLLPPDDQMLATKPQLTDKLRSLLGGRAAEEIIYGDCTTGPGNDLERTTALAKHMVCVYGMGESVGLMNCADRVGPAYLTSADAALQLDCSPDTGREIDLEIKKMLEGAYEDAKRMINQHRAELERLVAALEEHETVDAKQFAALMADEIPEFHAAEPGPVVPAAPAAS